MRLMDSCGCDWPQTISTGQHGTVSAKSIRSLFAPRANQIERGSKTAESGSLAVRSMWKYISRISCSLGPSFSAVSWTRSSSLALQVSAESHVPPPLSSQLKTQLIACVTCICTCTCFFGFTVTNELCALECQI